MTSSRPLIRCTAAASRWSPLLAAPALAVTPSGPAPAFELASLGGKPVNLSQYKGQVVMINFWATWCGPCRQEMPLLEQLHKKYKPMGFTMIGVNVEPDSAAGGRLAEIDTCHLSDTVRHEERGQ